MSANDGIYSVTISDCSWIKDFNVVTKVDSNTFIVGTSKTIVQKAGKVKQVILMQPVFFSF